MAFIDYYKILGVDRNIPQDQVREAYRKRAKLFHPDLHPNDPKAKAKFEGFDFSGFGSEGGGFSSFFQDLFGAKAGRSRSSRMRSTMRQNTGEMNANVNIDLYTALLGGEVIIQLGNGSKIKLKVKPETQNGTKVRLRGKGYDRGDGTMGDLIITYNVKLPTNLSDKQKQCLMQMRNSI